MATRPRPVSLMEMGMRKGNSDGPSEVLGSPLVQLSPLILTALQGHGHSHTATRTQGFGAEPFPQVAPWTGARTPAQLPDLAAQASNHWATQSTSINTEALKQNMDAAGY